MSDKASHDGTAIEPIRLQDALALARTLAPDELPALIGALAEVNAIAVSRLASPAMESRPDESLDVYQAAKRLGVSKTYLYRHWQRYKFARQEGRKILFSSRGIDSHLGKSR